MQESLERWLPVVGFEGSYEVSNQGRVKSLARVTVDGHRLKERIMKLSPSTTGYLQVNLRKDGRYHARKVHSLVAEAFIGPRPAGMHIRHGSTDRTDNRAANLSYGTRADNEADKVRDGVSNRGERCGSARLTREQVLLARRLVASGPKGTCKRLAREWGVAQSTLSLAVTGKNWAWLDAA